MTKRKPKKSKTMQPAAVPARHGEAGTTQSKRVAALVTSSGLTANTAHAYTGLASILDLKDLVDAMKAAGDEVSAGNFGRIEHMLTSQLILLDVLFSNLAGQSSRQDTVTGMEKLMRLALKAQSQARATAEALVAVKNPRPYIRQANIAHGNQQVNNGVSPPGPHADKNKAAPNKLLEQEHEQWLDTRAQATPGGADSALETVAAKHGSENG